MNVYKVYIMQIKQSRLKYTVDISVIAGVTGSLNTQP